MDGRTRFRKDSNSFSVDRLTELDRVVELDHQLQLPVDRLCRMSRLEFYSHLSPAAIEIANNYA